MKDKIQFLPNGWRINPDYMEHRVGEAWSTEGNRVEEPRVVKAAEIVRKGGSPVVRGSMDRPDAKFAVEAGSK